MPSTEKNQRSKARNEARKATRRAQAEARQAERNARTNLQQIGRLRTAGHGRCKEIIRLQDN